MHVFWRPGRRGPNKVGLHKTRSPVLMLLYSKVASFTVLEVKSILLSAIAYTAV